jgi:hypothetical protein
VFLEALDATLKCKSRKGQALAAFTGIEQNLKFQALRDSTT